MGNPLFRPFLGGAAPVAPSGLNAAIAMPSAAPSVGISTAPLVSRMPTQAETAQKNYTDLQAAPAGVDAIQNPLGHGIAKAADITASVFFPRLAQYLPGTTLNHERKVGQAAANAAEQKKSEQGTAEIANEVATTAHTKAATDALQNPQDKFSPIQTPDGYAAFDPKHGTATPVMGPDGQQIGTPEKAVKPKSIEEQAYEYAVQSGKNPVEALGAVYGAKAGAKDAGLPQQYLDAIASGDTTKAELIKKVIHDTQVQPKIDVHTANEPAGGSAGTWQMVMDKDGKPKFFNSKTGEIKDNVEGINKGKGDRATVDEQKRADLAKNMNENLDAMEDILSRRPELFGPIAGRMTDAKAGFGTDDPDIARMINIKHQLGMVAQGTHGMRSAQGIESAANSLLGGFHNSPAATKAALESARSSAATFINDANHPGQSRGADSGAPKAGDVVDGYKFNGGNPSDQKNWVKQ